MCPTKDQVNRSVRIGHDATGNVIQTGNNNVASLQFAQVTLPPPESVDIKAEFTEMRQLLAQLHPPDQKKMDRALEDAQKELAKPEADHDKIGHALDHALKYARKAQGFADAMAKLKPHLTRTVSWLGKNWYKLLSVVGLTI
jgi:hypothetical protein